MGSELNALPHNLEAEVSLLANIFMKNDILSETIGILNPSDFHSKANNIIYSKLVELYKNNIPIDLITFLNSVSKELLDSIGGRSYLVDVTNSEPTASNFKAYVKIIKGLSDRRLVIKSCYEAFKNAYEESNDTKDIINQLESKFLTMSESENQKTISSTELMEKNLDSIELNYNNGGKITGITTGFARLDVKTDGFVAGDLMVIAARPSMEKTALIMNMICRLPKDSKGILFEMEMAAEKIGIRLLAPRVDIEVQKLKRGLLGDQDFIRITEQCGAIANKDNVFLNCKTNLTVSEIRAEANKIKLRYGLNVIFIDHIGKIRPDNPKTTRNDQIGQITTALKNIAEDLKICVVVLSQLNREVEGTHDRIPRLSHLRDSGNIEQDADVVLMLYRKDYYRGVNEPKDGILNVLILKNRDGDTNGYIDLNYDLETQKIQDLKN